MAFALLLGSLLLAPALVHAGSYTVTYSGGNYTLPGAPGNDGPTSYGGWGGGSAGGSSASCYGTISATFTWHPQQNMTMTSDPPPTQVVVMETCICSASVQFYGAAGSYNSGLGPGIAGAVGSTTFVPGGSNNSISGTSVRYTPHAGGATVSLTGSAQASAAGYGGSCAVSYSAALTPVLVIPNGAIQDSSGNWNILVGQGCTSSLSTLPCPVSGWQWSVSGITFQAWSGATMPIPPAPANPNASYYVGGSGPLNNPTAHWYWDDNAGTKTVSCTATVTPPTGQGSPFSVTATQNISLAVPQVTESPTVGRVQINNHPPAVYGTDYALYAGGNTYQSYGIIFTTQVMTPALFATSSSGLWNMVQGVMPNLWVTPYQLWEIPNSLNGSSGLDTHYPLYPWSPGASPFFASGILANNLMAQPYDGPGIGSLSNANGRYRVSDSFSTFVMYLPPGTDDQWVPVWDVEWKWNADDSAPIVNNQPSWPSWNDANDAGTVAISSSARTLSFPLWKQIIHG